MKIFAGRRSSLLILLTILFVSQVQIYAQDEYNSDEELPSEKVAEKALNSAVMILTGKDDGILDKQGLGVVVGSDGVILTAYSLVKDAKQVQVRLKNGETFDKVDLLNFDERRNVAALRITAADLPVAPISTEKIEKKERVYVVSNSERLNWTVSDGAFSSLRLADGIPNAGKGFRVLEFSATILASSKGGILADKNGQAIGLIVSAIYSGEKLNYAVPFSSVTGLANTKSKLMSFASGSSLEFPKPVLQPSAIDIVNADPDSILRNAKFIYIYTGSVLISEKMMINALRKRREFKKWDLAIVNDSKNADIKINVEHQLFTWDYRYTVYDPKTQIILMSGKVTVWDGQMASGKFAKRIMKKMKQLKAEQAATSNKTSSKDR